MIAAFIIAFLLTALLFLAGMYYVRLRSGMAYEAAFRAAKHALAQERELRAQCETYCTHLEAQVYRVRAMCNAEPGENTLDAVRTAILRGRLFPRGAPKRKDAPS